MHFFERGKLLGRAMLRSDLENFEVHIAQLQTAALKKRVRSDRPGCRKEQLLVEYLEESFWKGCTHDYAINAFHNRLLHAANYIVSIQRYLWGFSGHRGRDFAYPIQPLAALRTTANVAR